VKRYLVLVAVVLVLVGMSSAQFGPATVATAADKNTPQLRLLTGQVTTHADAPLADAIVYLKNTKTLAIKTFITDAQGNYRFPALSPNVDYEVYAEYKGTKSDVKTLSSFDSRQHAFINLKVDGK
jgi:hypothetical protein